jgi:hypothetical protein
VRVIYDFEYEDGDSECFDLRFDPDSLDHLFKQPENPPSWTLLSNNMCPHCTLDRTKNVHCPLALCISGAVDRFHSRVSHESVLVRVTTDERTVFKRTTTQKGLSSMLGLLMPCSGCPHTRFFRPMARFHLPFSSEEETIYRSLSMFMLAKYFMATDGVHIESPLLELKAIYKNVECMNLWVARRIRSHVKADSSVNALVLLDLFAKIVSFLSDRHIETVRSWFSVYLEE